MGFIEEVMVNFGGFLHESYIQTALLCRNEVKTVLTTAIYRKIGGVV